MEKHIGWDNREYLDGGSYDVIVAGGGIAGVAAAVAAGRLGRSVLLLEKTLLLGGLATNGLISWFEPLCDGYGRQMTGGICEELIRLAVRYGFDTLPQEWKEKERKTESTAATTARYASFFSPTIFAMALDEFVKESGAEVLLDCLITYPVMDGGQCLGIVYETVEGRHFVKAGVVIDATGNACVMERAGMPTEKGDNYLTYTAHGHYAEDLESYRRGDSMQQVRRWMSVGSDYMGNGQPEGTPLVSGTTAREVTDFVLEGRRMFFDRIKAQEKNSRDVMMLPGMPQFRTVRHLKTQVPFVGQTETEDFIGRCGDFRKRGPRYAVPYSALCHPDFVNILAAGRVISTDQEGWEIARVIPVCALTGEAAGIAAAIAAAERSPVSAVEAARIRDLMSHGISVG